jgi:hypothetical protein
MFSNYCVMKCPLLRIFSHTITNNAYFEVLVAAGGAGGTALLMGAGQAGGAGQAMAGCAWGRQMGSMIG